MNVDDLVFDRVTNINLNFILEMYETKDGTMIRFINRGSMTVKQSIPEIYEEIEGELR